MRLWSELGYSYSGSSAIFSNPPFNVKDVKLDNVKNKPYFNEYGIPQNKTKSTGSGKEDKDTIPNANYLWINLFATSLNESGRAPWSCLILLRMRGTRNKRFAFA